MPAFTSGDGVRHVIGISDPPVDTTDRRRVRR
jgi:hypothetical protein